jgi:tetratricopeptide (TPR) repeat protein
VQAKVQALRSKPIALDGLEGANEYLKRGVRLRLDGSFAEAVSAFEESFRIYPTNTALYNKAATLREAGRHAEAVLAYERYLADPAIFDVKGSQAEEAQHGLEKAKKHLGGREALSTNIAASGKWFDKGIEQYRAKDYSSAFASFNRAYDLNPMADLRYNQAACLEGMGRKLLAVASYEKYLDEKPSANDAARVKKRIAKLRGEAKGVATTAFDQARKDYAEGRYKAAAEGFLVAFEQLGEPAFIYNRGAALDRAGDTRAAIKAYAWYLLLTPTASDAEKVRARIRKLQAKTGDELLVP